MRAVLFHNVVAQTVDGYDRQLERLTPSAFRREIDYLIARYRVVGFADAMAMLDSSTGDDSSVVLTFDDGFAGVLEVAHPILAEYGLTAAVFVLTDGAGGMDPARLLHFEELELAFRLTAAAALDLEWLGLDAATPLDDHGKRVRALRAAKRVLKLLPDTPRREAHARLLAALGVSRDAMTDMAGTSPRHRKLDVAGCRALAAAGWTIGGHTLSHPSLAHLDEASLTAELDANAHDLAALGFGPAPFAYPYGGEAHQNATVRAAAARAGFTCAWTTVPGENHTGTDRFALHRYSLPALHAADLSLPSRPYSPLEASSS